MGARESVAHGLFLPPFRGEGGRRPEGGFLNKKYIFRKLRSPEYVLGLARTMRGAMTPEEDILWERLRKRRLNGLRFRRQRPIGRYIVDFYCPEAGLIVEVDGDVHREREEYDRDRDAFLFAGGYALLRFTNDEVHTHPETVVETIRRIAFERRGSGKSP